jgi:hypothetical protein
MYCKMCGIQFEPWETKYGHIEDSVCKNCIGTHAKDKRYCIKCGGNLPYNFAQTKKGPTKVWGAKKFCDVCKSAQRTTPKYLKVHIKDYNAGTMIISTSDTRLRARSIAANHPEFLNILYECACEHPKKHHHHFDYSKPTEVLLLCPSCHFIWHAKHRKHLKNIAV